MFCQKKNKIDSKNFKMQDEVEIPRCSKGLVETVDKIGKSIEFMRKKLQSLDVNEVVPDPALALSSVECPSPPYVRRTKQPTRLERLQRACYDFKTQIVPKDKDLKCMKDQGFPETSTERQLNKLKDKKEDLEELGESMKYLIRTQSIILENYKQKYDQLQKTVEDQERYIEKIDEKLKKKEEKMKLDIAKMEQRYKVKLDEMIDFPVDLERLKAEQIQARMESLSLAKQYECLKDAKKLMKYKPKEDCEKMSELKSCQNDYSKLLKDHESVQKEKEELEFELETARNDYVSHKKESARNIARMKLHSSCEMQGYLQGIAELENELGSCMEWNFSEKTQRNEVLKNMKSQIQSVDFTMSWTNKQVHVLNDKLNSMPMLAENSEGLKPV